MAFHFPLMPRMYMAIAKEDRFPITDILRQTPAIPDACQWAIFLRNHDELTLEMVTDSERDYLWSVYASDRRARLNLGIRRRLAPLLERDRRRIELMNALLFTMPGTPVMYYGDEIGMGDNIHLGDRDGVRTPMQWSPDRNGGFSRADPEQLVLPPIQDPLYGYNALNVEAQQRDPHSLLNWTRRALAVRKRHLAFGRGGFRLLYPGNRKILAYLRTHGEETILCVANLSQTLQAVELDLSEFEQRVPVEMGGSTPFPPVGRLPYLLTLPPYGFYAFNLSNQTAEPSWHSAPPEQLPEFVTLVLRGGLPDLLSERHRPSLEGEALPAYVARRRWLAPRGEAAKGQRLSVRLAWAMPLPKAGNDVFLAGITVELADGAQHFVLPLAIAWEDQNPPNLAIQLALARVRQGRRVGYLTDALALDSLPHAVIRALRSWTTLDLPDGGQLRFSGTERLAEVEIPPEAAIHRSGSDEATTTIAVEECATFKVVRRARFGIDPEAEMARHLTAQGFSNMPPLLGEVARISPDGAPAVLALLYGYVRNQGDAWNWVIDQVRRALNAASQTGEYLEHAFEEQTSGLAPFFRAVGRSLGSMHAVLARPSEDASFAPRAAVSSDCAGWASEAEADLKAASSALSSSGEVGAAVADALERLREACRTLAAGGVGTRMTRVHGDFTLPHVLVSGGDAYILDFDGNASGSDPRRKDSPLRDVADMMTSIDALAAHVDASGMALRGNSPPAARRSLMTRFTSRAQRAFLAGYAEASAPLGGADRALMDLFLIIAYARRAATDHGPLERDYGVRALHGLAVRYAGAIEVDEEPALAEVPA